MNRGTSRSGMQQPNAACTRAQPSADLALVHVVAASHSYSSLSATFAGVIISDYITLYIATCTVLIIYLFYFTNTP